MTLLLLPHECSDGMWVPPCPVYVVLGVKPRTFSVLGRPLPPGYIPARSLFGRIVEIKTNSSLGHYIMDPGESLVLVECAFDFAVNWPSVLNNVGTLIPATIICFFTFCISYKWKNIKI